MRNWVKLTGFVVVFAIGWGGVVQAQDEAGAITIGAWNIEWLGMPGNRSGIAKNVAQKPEDIAAYIKLTGVDVLALEEIGDDDDVPGTKTNTTLNAAFQKLNTDGGQWEYRLFPKKNAAEKGQLTGVAWNKTAVTLEAEPFKIEVVDDNDQFNLWDRDPHAAKFQMKNGANDFVVIPVHMKSNVGGAAITRQQRKLEAQALMARLSAIKAHYKDQDIVILGDINSLNANEAAITTFTANGLTDLNGNDEPTTFHGPAPFDRIFVPDNQPEFDNSFQFVAESQFTANQHKRNLSDHYMVTTFINIQAADDDAD